MSWLHGISSARPETAPLACLLEAVRATRPDAFWQGVERLYRSYLVVGESEWIKLLGDLPLSLEKVSALARDEAIIEAVTQDYRMVRACGAPEVFPAFIVGRRIFWGPDAVSDLFRHLADT